MADALFAVMEGTALWLFAKSRPVSIASFVGCVLAFGMIVLSIYVEFLLLTSYM